MGVRACLGVLWVALSVIIGGGFVAGAGTGDGSSTDHEEPEPRVEEHTWDGRVSCLIMTGNGYTGCRLVEGGDESLRHDFNVEEDLKTLWVRMEWNPSEEGSEQMELTLQRRYNQTNPLPFVTQTSIHTYAEVTSASPIELRLDAGEIGGEHDFENIEDQWDLRFYAKPRSQIGIVQNQSFQVHYSLYYHDHAPPGDPAPPTLPDRPPEREYVGTTGSGVTCPDPPILGEPGFDIGGACDLGVPDPDVPTQVTVQDEVFEDDIRFRWHCRGIDSSGPSGYAKGDTVVNPTASGECTRMSVSIHAPATNGTISLTAVDVPPRGPPPRLDAYTWDGYIECMHQSAITYGSCNPFPGTQGVLTGEPQQNLHHNRLTRDVIAVTGIFEWDANGQTEGPLRIHLGTGHNYPFEFEGAGPVAFELDEDDLAVLWEEEPDRDDLTLRFKVSPGSEWFEQVVDQPFTVDYAFHVGPEG